MQNIPDKKKRECLSKFFDRHFIVFCLVFVTGGKAMNGMKKGTTVRPMAVAGQFYPRDQRELSILFESHILPVQRCFFLISIFSL
jgi:hypothetical protein